MLGAKNNFFLGGGHFDSGGRIGSVLRFMAARTLDEGAGAWFPAPIPEC